MAIKLVGADDIAGTSLGTGYFSLSNFTAVATGNMTQFRVKSLAAGNVKCAIYADSAGEPGALITAMNTGQAVVIGWNTLDFTSTPITSGTVYWLAFIFDTAGAGTYASYAGVSLKYRAGTYAGWTFPDPAGTGFSSASDYEYVLAGWGESGQTISPPGLSQPISYGTPKLSLSIKPTGHQQVVAYGTPTVQKVSLVIYPIGSQVVISYGTSTIIAWKKILVEDEVKALIREHEETYH